MTVVASGLAWSFLGRGCYRLRLDRVELVKDESILSVSLSTWVVDIVDRVLIALGVVKDELVLSVIKHLSGGRRV